MLGAYGFRLKGLGLKGVEFCVSGLVSGLQAWWLQCTSFTRTLCFEEGLFDVFIFFRVQIRVSIGSLRHVPF